MSEAEAQRILSEAYRSLDAGHLLRRTNRELRRRGIDPPMDVEYVAEPHIETYPEGRGVSLGADILVYSQFPEMEACLDAFESALANLVVQRVERAVKRWERARRGSWWARRFRKTFPSR